MNINYLKKINPKNKLFISVGLLLTANLAMIYFLTIPATDSIKDSRNDIINLKIDLENKIIREKNISTLNEKINKIEPQLQKINQIFISKNREIEFITALEGLENKHNIKQKLNINLNSPNQDNDLGKIPLNINASGNFQNLMDYLAGIESLNYYINIENISLTKNNAGDYNSRTSTPGQVASNQMDLSISGYAYWK
ncbi:MAG TPA: type 4a pilus biogenesis protein PilO [bacterium]|nr:type 4a pilus biogenesis protein PilO [bacterium]